MVIEHILTGTGGGGSGLLSGWLGSKGNGPLRSKNQMPYKN